MNKDIILYELKNITYTYPNNIIALDNISLQIKKNSIFAIIGANGCGKSTLMYILNGLIFPNKGEIIYNGDKLSEEKFRDREFVKKFRSTNALLFQDSDVQLFCSDVFSELSFSLIQLKLFEKEIIERVNQVAKLLNITDLLNRSVSALSGGEKKKVAIASILTLNPDVILLDEPTSDLDPKAQGLIVEILLELHNIGKSIIITTNDLGLIDDLKPQLCIMNEQHKIETIGKAEEILENEELLMKVNLIHKHLHIHNGSPHKHIHSHYKIHKH